MVFSSTIFLFCFLPLTLMGYYLINPKYRNSLLLLCSIFFYGWGEPKFIFVVLAVIFLNYISALGIEKFRQNIRRKKIILVIMVVLNIGVFFVYKYLNFTIWNLNYFLHLSLPQTNILLPIGISFIAFQAMSYVFDVYTESGRVQKNPLNVALYILLFPQLIAGPIVRYDSISESINVRKETKEDFAEGVRRFIIGLAKKMILANSLAIVVDKAYSYINLSELSVSMAWLGAICYTFQIYYDFSGYSDMAIGLGKMFGFHFNENFNYPYISTSISDFWRRWHISLSTWFRDYVYFPMGGSRTESKLRLVFNLLVVWLLTGIWHGASWNFVVWGLYYFILLTFEKLTNIPDKLNRSKVLYKLFTLFMIIIGWVLFRANNLKHAIEYLKSMFGLNNNLIFNQTFVFYMRENIVQLFLAIVFSYPIIQFLDNHYLKNNSFVDRVGMGRVIVYLILFIVSISYVVTSTYNPFIYFNF